MFLDGLEDAYEPGRAMGTFAQDTANDYQFTREAQDAYAAAQARLHWLIGAPSQADAPLLEGAAFVPGRYRLVFGVQAYFAARGTPQAEPAFLGEVPLDFGIADTAAHYHVPLLVSPWSYSTYRGS